MLAGTFSGPKFLGGQKQLLFVDQAGSSSNASSYSFTNTDLGVADDYRWIIVYVQTRRGAVTINVTGVTVGGVSLSMFSDLSWQSNNNEISSWIGRVPSGASGTVDVTLNTSTDRCTIFVFALYGWESTPVLETSGQDSTTGSSNSRTATTSGNVSAGAFLIAATFIGAATTISWSGDVTEVGVDQQNDITASCATGFVTAGGSTKTATASYGGSALNGVELLAII